MRNPLDGRHRAHWPRGALKQDIRENLQRQAFEDLARRFFLITFVGIFFPVCTYALTSVEMSFGWRLMASPQTQ